MNTASTAEKTEETTSDTAQNTGDAKPLILPSLEIKNFRAFKHLTIEKLGRVNLITGKNNVGKTSLLEALWLYAERGSPLVVRNLLRLRNELSPSTMPISVRKGDGIPSRVASEPKVVVQLLKSVRAMSFTDDNADENEAGRLEPISIGYQEDRLQFSVDWFRVFTENAEAKPQLKRVEYEAIDFYDAQPYATVSLNKNNIKRYRLTRLITGGYINSTIYQISCLPVWTTLATPRQLEILWRDVLMSGLKDEVIEALSFIIPNVLDVDFVVSDTSSRLRKPYLTIAGNSRPIPLARFGDGVNHLFYFMCALVNSAGGILLIDEIENGLHYSVLPEVWRLIFQTARKLNVQVFATTHSWDCIEAFQEAASEDDDPQSGVLVRLQNENGEVTSTVFDERRLAIVAYNDIEVR